MKVLGDTQTIYFILDEPSEMMKKEAKRSEDFQKLAAVKQDQTVYQIRQAGFKVKPKMRDQDFKSVNRKVKFKDW